MFQQVKFVDKLLTRIHTSIVNIHEMVGEEQAEQWMVESKEKTKAAESKTTAKTPVKRPIRVRFT